MQDLVSEVGGKLMSSFVIKLRGHRRPSPREYVKICKELSIVVVSIVYLRHGLKGPRSLHGPSNVGGQSCHQQNISPSRQRQNSHGSFLYICKGNMMVKCMWWKIIWVVLFMLFMVLNWERIRFYFYFPQRLCWIFKNIEQY